MLEFESQHVTDYQDKKNPKHKKPQNTQRKITESKAYNSVSPTKPITQAKYTRKKKQEKEIQSQDKKQLTETKSWMIHMSELVKDF